MPGCSGTSGGAGRDAFEGFSGDQSYGPFTINPELILPLPRVEEIPMARMEGEFSREFKRQFKDWLENNNRQ